MDKQQSQPVSQVKYYWKPLLAIIFWGASFIATKIALKELAPLTIIFSRLILGILLLVVLALTTGHNIRISPRNFLRIFVLALIASFHLWIQVTGLEYTSASNTGWIIGLTPVFMALLGALFFHESLKFIRVLGIVISFSGLLLLISKGDFHHINLISNKGDFLVLASAFTWSVYSIVNKKISLSFSPLLTVLFLFGMMAVIISPFTISSKSIQTLVHLSSEGWLAIMFLGFLCSGVAYVLWAQALKEMESTTAGAFLYFEPFVTVFTAWLILREDITILTILSGIVITAGVVLVSMNFSRKGKSEK